MGDTAPVLRIDGLVRRFGERTAVDGVSFQIAAGETYGLLGPNGAGKTTTISMIAGILAADAGSVHVHGVPITTAANPHKRHIGFVPQQIALFDDLTARENLRFFGGLQGLRGKALDARIAATLDMVGLSDRADDRIDAFSGGMQRRANIAVGLLHEPTLLILDEPTAGVDPQSRNQILESVEQLGTAGLSVLYTTHYMEEAERLCDRVGVIDNGRLIAEGTRRELVTQIGEHDRIVVRGDDHLQEFAAHVRHLPGVVEVSVADHSAEVSADDGAAVLAGVVTCAVEVGMAVTGVEVHEPNLESVFLHLTGKALRDRAD
ncbi:MAG: ABC transporter ATP-binding protein [Actinomycetota bacterium]|nr:ABC transporter ATP-binding protein [Actinomycetota bacterium]